MVEFQTTTSNGDSHHKRTQLFYTVHLVFWRRVHAGSSDGRGGVSGIESVRQAARRRVGGAGGGQFPYRRQGQPEPSGEEQQVQVPEGEREQAAESGGKSGLRAALRF